MSAGRPTRSETDRDSTDCPSHDRGPSAKTDPLRLVPACAERPECGGPHPLLMGIPKAKAICCAIRGHPHVGFRCLMSRTAAMTSWLGPFGPGFFRTLNENSRRYFRCVSARWSLKSVEGFRMIAERISRRGRMRSAHTPATMRSARRRLGERFRERLRISSWCLTSTDSATTARAPPGPASRATVARRCRNRMARSRTTPAYQDRDIQKCP